MKRIAFLVIAAACAVTISSQSLPNLDSLKRVLQQQKDDSSKIASLQALCWAYNFYKPDSADFYAQEALAIARRIHSPEAEELGYFFSWASQFVKGNYYRAIEIITTRLRELGDLQDVRIISDSYKSLFNCYRDVGDYGNALSFIRKASRIEDSLGIRDWGTYMLLGDGYERVNQLDSALFYGLRAYELAMFNKEEHSWISHVLGNIYTKLQQPELALIHYRLSLEIARKNGVYKDVMDNQNGIASLFVISGQTDSVIYYSKEALKYFNTVYYPKGGMEAAARLAKAYKSTNSTDSSLKYFELSNAISDSIYSQQKMMQVQNLAFAEKERQAEASERKEKEDRQRRHNIQYATLGIGIISFLILFLLLSHSIIVKTGLVKYLGIIALLLVFEFIDLWTHPYLKDFTNDSPLLMLLILVGIAALLIPAHHRLEKWVVGKLTEKNKRIRLAAARKTIAELEKGNA